jgi:hypothetical protein
MGKKSDRAIAQLNANIRDLQRELKHFIERHRTDIATIGQRLIEETENRDCGHLYDNIASELNRSLSVPLPGRPQPFTVCVSVDLHIDVIAHGAADARDEAYPRVLKVEDLLDGLPGITAYADRDSVKYAVTAR